MGPSPYLKAGDKTAGFDASALRKYDMVADLLHAVQLHADWGLPDDDPVAWVSTIHFKPA